MVSKLVGEQGTVRSSLSLVAILAIAGMALTGRAHLAKADEPAGAVTKSQSEAVYVVGENGRNIEVRIVNGKLEKATVDGKAISKDRVQMEPDRIIVKNDDGTVLTQIDVSHGQGDERKIEIMPERRARALRRLQEQDGQREVEVAPERVKASVMLGLRLEPLPALLAKHLGLEGKGLLVAGVAKGLPAEMGGLKPYDVILSVNGESVGTATEFIKRLVDGKVKAGESVKLAVVQQGQKKELSIAAVGHDREKLDGAEWDQVEAGDLSMPLGGLPFGSFKVGPEEMDRFMVMPEREGQEDALSQALRMLEKKRYADPRIQEKIDEAIRELGGRPPQPPVPPEAPEAPPAPGHRLGREQREADLAKLQERLRRMEQQLQEMQKLLKDR